MADVFVGVGDSKCHVNVVVFYVFYVVEMTIQFI
jgi:hypothetical protein